MSTTQITDYTVVPMYRKFSWSGIFSGTFLFLGIEVTFGVLGVAIFNSINTGSANSIGHGTSVGAGIWMAVLSIIALYFAGKLASTHSLTTNRNSGMYAGLVTFGMCILTSFLVIFPYFGATSSPVSGFGGIPPASALNLAGSTGYWLFVTLILGMIAAAAGGIHGSMIGGTRAAVERTTDTKRVA